LPKTFTENVRKQIFVNSDAVLPKKSQRNGFRVKTFQGTLFPLQSFNW